MKEQWLPAINFEHSYEASNYGQLRRIKGRKGQRVEKILRCSVGPYGYRTTTIMKKPIRLHKIIAETFFGIRPKGLQINHKDGNKANNNIDNLEYATASENIRHSFKLGLRKILPGDNSPNHKLTEIKVKKIKNLIMHGKSERWLARKFHVSHNTIHQISSGQTWSFV